ncbi:SGNH/GDSL hydrolase family protein [bacterium]|nr:SGNH/GDSL hydrolase family protein [bacterium]
MGMCTFAPQYVGGSGRLKKWCHLLSFLICSHLFLPYFAATALACPMVAGLVDPTCDEEIRMFFVGDSIVRGVGDPARVGYPRRVEDRIGDPRFTAFNLGIPGIEPGRLRRALIRRIRRGRRFTTAISNADYGFIQVGTNSYWKRQKPFRVVMKIVRLKRYLERELEERNGVPPVLFTAQVPLTEREYQNPFLEELNREIARKKYLNAFVNFGRIPVERLDIQDSLHPGARGYSIMAKQVHRALYRQVQRKASQIFGERSGAE